MTENAIAIHEVSAGEYPAMIADLGAILHESVLAGASVGFVLPFAIEEAESFFRSLEPALASGSRRLLVARREGHIVGTIQLVFTAMPNGSHRAEVAKLLVAPGARRQGIGQALMAAVEALARAKGLTLLHLDTRSEDDGERLYRRLGYEVSGRIPTYCRSIDGVLEATTIMYKILD